MHMYLDVSVVLGQPLVQCHRSSWAVVYRLEETEAGDGALGRSLPKLKNPTTLSIIREHGKVKVHATTV